MYCLQYVTEKMGGAEGTKLDLDFMEMERVSTHNNFILPQNWNHGRCRL